jgi:membrane-associated phospholipid phosphatase
VNQSKTLDNVSSVGYFYGGIQNAAIIAVSLYIGGIAADEVGIRKTGRDLAEALFYSGITTILLKTVLGRSRPFTNDGAFHFKLFQTDNAHTSLPSGHITVAFAVSSVLASKIENPYASVLLYSLAGSTFIQRIYSDDHWLSDSILAASIGYFVGRAVVNYENSGNDANRISFVPNISSNGIGMIMSYSF